MRFVVGLEVIVSGLCVFWARSTASFVVLWAMSLCWWLSGATSIVGDRIIPALIGFVDCSLDGEWGAVACDPWFLSMGLRLSWGRSTMISVACSASWS